MKKRMLAVLMTFCMVFVSASVMAAETEESTAESAAASTAEEADEVQTGTVEFGWEDIASQEGAEEMIAAGEFVTFDEIACKMWVPAVMPAVELTEEDTEAGYIGYFSTEDESGIASVMYVNVDSMSLEEYKEYLSGEEDVTGITDVVVNGIQAVGYDLEETDTTCIAFATEAGYILEFAFAPASDEGYSSVILTMMASIQPEEAAEETADSEAAAS